MHRPDVKLVITSIRPYRWATATGVSTSPDVSGAVPVTRSSVTANRTISPPSAGLEITVVSSGSDQRGVGRRVVPLPDPPGDREVPDTASPPRRAIGS